MKAVLCKQFGPPEDLVVEQIDPPSPGPGEVLVAIRAAAITFPDTLIIEDRYQFKAKPPFVLGGEVAGVVEALGEGTTGFQIGDAVVGGGGTGGFAEYVAVPAQRLRKIPKGLEFQSATGFWYAHGTGHYALKYRADLQPGETMLVLGAAGSVGLAAIQLGKIMGARVIAAASSAAKLQLCRECGADDTILYSEEDLKTRAKELTAGRGVDVVYDAVGGDRAEAALRAIAWRGRFLVIGFTAGIPKLPLNLTLLKGCQVLGVFWGAARTKEPEIADAVTAELDALAGAGKLAPMGITSYRLDDVPGALRAMMDRKVQGKLIAAPQGD